MSKLPLKNTFSNQLIVAFGLISIILISRFTAHAWNMTAVGGVALFAGSFFAKKQYSFLVLIAGLFLTDCVLGFHNQMLPVYFSYLLIAVLGFALNTYSTRFKVVGFSILGSALFFLITNMTSWYGNAFYAQDINGLFESYYLGIPFFRNQILGDVLSAAILFELAKLVQHQQVSETKKSIS